MEIAKILFSLFCVFTYSFSSSLINLPDAGVDVGYKNLKGELRFVKVEREIKPECLNVDLSPEAIWGGNFANSEIHKNCKKEFVSVKGIIQPIKFNDKINTVGELEVLDFLKNKVSKEPEKYALIDSRPFEWYQRMTIAGAINVPYDELEVNEIVSRNDFEANLAKLGLKIRNNKIDTSGAKTIILFCNGAWCTQSSQKIKKLIKFGYPQDKIFWYRGGMQSWTSMALSVVNPGQ